MIELKARRLVAAVLVALAPLVCWADDLKAVRLVVPTPPGGSMDATGRLLAQRASALSGENWIVENRPGGNSVIAAEFVARTGSDGRTVLLGAGGLSLVPVLQKGGFSPLDELAPVLQLTREHWVLVGGPATDMPLAELVKRVADGSLSLSCAAPAGPGVIACEQLKQRMGGKLVVASYTGIAPALTALLGGHVGLMVTSPEPVAKHVEAGRLRGLAHTGVVNAQWLRDAPIFREAFPGFVLESHMGILTSAQAPAARVKQLNATLNQVLAQPDVQALMRERMQDPVGGSPEHYRQTIGSLQRRFAGIISELQLDKPGRAP